MKRYHPLLVGLHWLVAVMILVALLIGGPSLAEMKNSDPEKMFGLTGHMIWGLSIGALMIVRLAMRAFSKRPLPASAGNALLNSGAKFAHLGLYVLVLAMVASGLGIAISADLFAIVFSGSGAPLPADFSIYAARQAHAVIATLLLILIGLHIAGWVYHQFYLQDRLISRMWFGKRT
ncbi:cytochrome b/b6 domain-containing protein [Leisingera sp. F5]|uniref:cytochrome b n=1 Tax=Leisingera sp. F5 TaxID=1813816 RepID=UPI000A907CF7|nr:cytochrome b/b6 domain-containing protein [Leisingera sp. F5]